MKSKLYFSNSLYEEKWTMLNKEKTKNKNLECHTAFAVDAYITNKLSVRDFL